MVQQLAQRCSEFVSECDWLMKDCDNRGAHPANHNLQTEQHLHVPILRVATCSGTELVQMWGGGEFENL